MSKTKSELADKVRFQRGIIKDQVKRITKAEALLRQIKDLVNDYNPYE